VFGTEPVLPEEFGVIPSGPAGLSAAGLRSELKEEESARGGFRGTFAEKARRPRRGLAPGPGRRSAGGRRARLTGRNASCTRDA